MLFKVKQKPEDKEKITHLILKQDSSGIFPYNVDVDVIAEVENEDRDLIMTFRNGKFKRWYVSCLMAEKLGIEIEAENFKIKEGI